MRCPVTHAFREPKSDLLLSVLNRVRSVTDVTSDVNAEVTTDGTAKRISRLGGTKP